MKSQSERRGGSRAQGSARALAVPGAGRLVAVTLEMAAGRAGVPPGAEVGLGSSCERCQPQSGSNRHL